MLRGQAEINQTYGTLIVQAYVFKRKVKVRNGVRVHIPHGAA